MRILIPTIMIILTIVSPQIHATTWNADTIPAQHSLLCNTLKSYSETRSINALTRQYGIVGNVQKVADLIRAMKRTGWRRTGNNQMSLTISVRFIYDRTIEYAAKANNNGLTLRAKRTSAGRSQVVPASIIAMQYMTEQLKQRIKADYRQWRDQYKNNLADIRTRLHKKYFPYKRGELSYIRSHHRGTIKRSISYNHCGVRYNIGLTGYWYRGPKDRPLGGDW